MGACEHTCRAPGSTPAGRPWRDMQGVGRQRGDSRPGARGKGNAGAWRDPGGVRVAGPRCH